MATSTIMQRVSAVSYSDIEFLSESGTTAGTIGTRALQLVSDFTGGTIISMATMFVQNSSYYNVQVFHSNNKIYCNYYRADANAHDAAQTKVKVRVVYI